MKKLFSFMAGALCGALVGGVLTLLFTPASGEDLVSSAQERWQLAKDEARTAREETQRQMVEQFEMARRGG